MNKTNNRHSADADQKRCSPTVLIACENLKPEIEGLHPADHAVQTRYMDHDLHRTPERMTPYLQEEIDRAAPYAARIVLGYGLCSNGTAGLNAATQGLWIPRVHDCIALYLGSREAYDKAFQEHPGTYYLTKAWIENERDPLGIIEHDYAPRLGYQTALWAMQQELKNYERIVYINAEAAAASSAQLRARAQENARCLGKTYQEIEGNNQLFEKLVFGPYTVQDFVYVKAGDTIQPKAFAAEQQPRN